MEFASSCAPSCPRAIFIGTSDLSPPQDPGAEHLIKDYAAKNGFVYVDHPAMANNEGGLKIELSPDENP